MTPSVYKRILAVLLPLALLAALGAAVALHCSADAIVFGAPKEERDGRQTLLTLFASMDQTQRELTAEVLMRMLKALPAEEE